MKLVIAEKPMLARDIARAICGKSVSETARLPISGNGYTVCACAGHILNLVEPDEVNPQWKKWNIEDLPIVIEDWAKKPTEGKESLVETISELLSRAECVINAGDPDDEGQLIVDEVLDYLGWNGQTLRVLVNDNIEKNIVRAFNDLKDNNQFVGLGRAAYARQMADKCFGINETRLATKKLGAKLNVGRVQTPTLGLVVARDEQIENHIKQNYYELFVSGSAVGQDGKSYDCRLKFMPNEELLAGQAHILDQSLIETVAQKLQTISDSLTITSKEKKEHPPLPYNLTKLQSDMSKRYKFSAKKTLDLTQALRDKYKAITYNRSDSQYLKEEHYVSAPKVLTQAMSNCHNVWNVDYSIKSKAFNEANVTAHHGIIPQEVEIDIDKMSQDEAKVYLAIVERYAMQFMPPALYVVSTGSIKVSEGLLKYSNKELKDKGYRQYVSKGVVDKAISEDEASLEEIPDGTYAFQGKKATVETKETTPPKRYTEGTLIADMASISKYVEDERIKAILKQKDDGKKGENGGIGTTATRASIIEKLKENDYLKEEKGKLVSTQKARDFYHLLPDEIKKADTTALWWLIQQDISEGKQDVNAVQKSVVEVFLKHKDNAYAGATLSSSGTTKVVGVCPLCGQDVLEKGKTYQCSSNKYEKGTFELVSGCGFKTFKSAFGKAISASQMAKLLQGKEVLVKSLKSKKGKPFDAYLALNLEEPSDKGFYSVNIVRFPDKKVKKK